ncbi:MAG: hypothetical protein A3D92_19160 [Bacteroidetes bacterium RIFCSPHIGHO2_02_FULL_44_7]|nr:MAG: hypothetical protein A3D92_19160 [Bacteroidetes bacterium RIFCSPHIGHO2_02_FULL_44_7]
MQKRLVLVVLILLLVHGVSYSQGCSQCKLVAEQGSALGEDSFGSNINYGIYILMTLPYLIFLIAFRKRIYRFFRSKFARS